MTSPERSTPSGDSTGTTAKDSQRYSATYDAETRVLEITLDGKATHYFVEQLDPDPSIGSPAFRLTKLDGSGSTYDTILRPWGWSCECKDTEYRKRLCKHTISLKIVGLIRNF